VKLLIHDLEPEDFKKLFPSPLKETRVISDDGTIHPCIGCFGCWIKTPGACVIPE
jgi:multimeric flavodoxin WrbA